MTDIKSMYLSELELFAADNGLPKYRAKQIFRWLHKGVSSFEMMTDLPKKDIQLLSSICYISVANIEKKLVSSYDDTVKYLFSFPDGQCVEAVVMKYSYGRSMCISTQAGCKMGCTFCATGQNGFVRNLTASEMISEINAAEADLSVRISNVVLMGMGEPLDNFDNVVRFLNLVSDTDGLCIGIRHITLSTCGIVPRIYDLARLNFGLTLSVSLHAPTDTIRSRTMPVNKKYPTDMLFAACADYAKITGRRVTYEYAMINGVNDTDKCAVILSDKIKNTLCHVNLIPVNPVDKTGYLPSSDKRIRSFCRILESNGINSTVRRTLGSDINASCGQLRGINQQK